MKLKIKAIFLLFLFCVTGTKAQDVGLRSSIIPAPAKIEKHEGQFVFNDQTVITTDDMVAQPIVRIFKAYLSARSKSGRVQSKRNSIRFTSKGADDLPDEGYKLNITPEAIVITGKKVGLFYGMQSLIQLLPIEAAETLRLPCMNITDYPRFAYRGLMLDVSRHFFSVAQIKELLDMMSQYKLNRFHWHLTDDQGWRIEIKSLPKLTEVGAFRVPRNGDFGAMEAPRPGEKATDGGFYTQDEVREIIRYAAERNIQVMPEIDVPGHSMAAIAAYPHLSCTQDTSIKVSPGSSFAKWFPDRKFEMYIDNTLNPTSEETYVFLDKVFTEVAALFPYEYIHIGGDECYKGFWERDAGVQAFMKKMNIGSTHELQDYFTSRLNKIIRSKNKKLIGWDEILDGGLNDQVAIMNRFGEKGAITQLKKKLNIVLAPGNNGLYFDYAQSRSDMEPINHGGFSPVWKAYGYNPEYEGLNEEDKKHIMGVSGCIWTENIPSISKLQYMIFPRMFALAETAWSQEYNKDYKGFAEVTLPKHLEKLDKAGYNYRVPTPFVYTDTTFTGKHFHFDLKVPMAGAKIYYTLNNRLPGDADHEYQGPVTFDIPEGKKRILKIIVISPSGRRSVVTNITLDNSN
ncbi:Beta-hexosaminidase [compost metagenome]